VEGKITYKITITKVWLAEKTDCSECEACKDKIFSDMYRLWLMPDVGKLRKFGRKTDIVLCESCFNML
jgi:hypothetical protein